MADNWIQSILDNFKERTTYPFISSFVVSWLIWNYKVIFVLFSSDNYVEKFQYVSNDVMNVIGGLEHPLLWLLNGIVAPTVLALCYIILYPKIAIPIYEIYQTKKIEKENARKKAEQVELIDRKKYDRVIDQRNGLDAKIKELLEVINSQRDTINRLQESQDQTSEIDIPIDLNPSSSTEDESKQRFDEKRSQPTSADPEIHPNSESEPEPEVIWIDRARDSEVKTNLYFIKSGNETVVETKNIRNGQEIDQPADFLGSYVVDLLSEMYSSKNRSLKIHKYAKTSSSKRAQLKVLQNLKLTEFKEYGNEELYSLTERGIRIARELNEAIPH